MHFAELTKTPKILFIEHPLSSVSFYSALSLSLLSFPLRSAEIGAYGCFKLYSQKNSETFILLFQIPRRQGSISSSWPVLEDFGKTKPDIERSTFTASTTPTAINPRLSERQVYSYKYFYTQCWLTGWRISIVGLKATE